MTRASGAAGLPSTWAIPPPVAEHRDLGVLRPGRPAHWGRFFPSPRGKLFMLSLLNNSFNSRPRLGIPLLGQGKLAFDQQGQDDSDPLAEHADQPIPSGAFRASLVKRLAENNLSVCGYFSAVFSSQHLSLSGQY